MPRSRDHSQRLGTKKWTGSKANQYISRKKACKRLQIALPAFRKLCILKGIYPHDPKKKHKRGGDRRVYYHAKDIKHLSREPILWQWRRQRTFRTRLTRHKGRHNWDKVKRMQLSMPQISIDHLVRERYPTFPDALRDLDDCATFIFLFASLPSGILPQLTALRRLECQKLCREFSQYIAARGLLTKVFLSVKGVYCQARLRGKFDVTWVEPHAFAHSAPDDVDYRVMSSFLDFYLSMFRFVVFKLYKAAKMDYPPFGAIDYDLTSLSLHTLRARKFTTRRRINIHKMGPKTHLISQNQKQIETETDLLTEKTPKLSEASKVVTLDLSKILSAEDVSSDKKVVSERDPMSRSAWSRATLFEDFVFLLNRECPQLQLEFVILALGGKVLFEQDLQTKKERASVLITHQIADRTMPSTQRVCERVYVQPQWVADCVNSGAIVPTEHYAMGVQCPPHLSPFVRYGDGKHKPSQAFVLEHWKEVSKQFGGFVPSKKLMAAKKRESEEKEEVKEEEAMAMELDVADILDGDVQNAEEEESEEVRNGEEEESEEEEVMERVTERDESVLESQRLAIADRGRRRETTERMTQHSLEKDGIPVTKEERMEVNLARTMMAKKFRKSYDKIRRSATQKSKHVKFMDKKRQRAERKQRQKVIRKR